MGKPASGQACKWARLQVGNGQVRKGSGQWASLQVGKAASGQWARLQVANRQVNNARIGQGASS
eukprot:8669823-Lingulodinium_polyedra.AAC.1